MMQSRFNTKLTPRMKSHQRRPSLLDNLRNYVTIGGKALKIVCSGVAKYLRIIH